VWRQVTVTASVLDKYRYNHRFKVVAGGQYFKNGVLQFPTPVLPHRDDKFYRTHFGYGIPHSGVIYARNDHNLSLSLRRLTGSREPDNPASEPLLQLANDHHFRVVMAPHLYSLSQLYAPYFETYMGMREEARVHHADPHPKRELRMRAYKELVDTGTINLRHWSRTFRGQPVAEGKMKTEEYAKPGKKPRMIVDLSVAASLQGFRLTEMLKTAQSTVTYRVYGGEVQFIKDPSPTTMQEVFTKLISPPGKFYYCYFSDDACLAVRVGAIVYRYNLDISSCDASHTTALFDALVAVVPEHCKDDMRVLVEQCTYQLAIRSVANRGAKVVIKPLSPRLYSGSTITTAINNLANLGIAVAAITAVLALGPNPTAAQVGAAIIAGARSAGYIVTLDTCDRPEQLQFLKHSPIQDVTGVYRPMLNLGVLLRLSGACKKDLPGRGAIKPRAQQFQHALLNGLYTGSKFPLLTAMRARVPNKPSKPIQKAVDLLLRDRHLATRPVDFTDTEICRRYSLDTAFVAEVQALGTVDFEEQIGNAALARVLEVDYGLTVNKVNITPTIALYPRLTVDSTPE